MHIFLQKLHFYQKKLLSAAIILLIAFFNTSCAVNLKMLVEREKELKNRNDFNSYLSREYLEYSRHLANQYNWRDSDFFAKKGLRAANNKNIFPEAPEAWDLDSSQIEEASLGRQKLELLLNPKTKGLLPIQLAHLVLLYDCWITKEKEPWQLAEMSRCKVRFFKLSAEIEQYLKNLKPPEIIIEEKLEIPKFDKVNIYFDLNSYKFNDDANEQFLSLLTDLSELRGNYRLLLVGNADTSGKSLYNDSLARKRALNVRNKLIKNGVPKDLIAIKSMGEIRPYIITKNNKTNKHNRVVGVYILEGTTSFEPLPLPLIDNYIYKQEILKNKKEQGLL